MPPPDIVARVRAYDLASTPENADGSINRLGDFTASCMMSKDRHGNYYIEHVERIQKHSGKVMEHIIKTALDDGIDECKVILPKDGGAAGTAYYNYQVKELASYGIPCAASKVSGHLSKLNRTLPFCNVAQTGCVYIVRGDWDIEYMFTELENFVAGNRNQKDDVWDCVGDAFNALSRQVQMPTFKLPDLSKPSVTAGIF